MSAIKNEIKSIYIKNIKGYNEDGKTVGFDNNGQGLLPNKLNIVVAPNGFGKSSLTVAINSTHHGRKIHLDKKEYFKEDDSLNSEVNIICKLDDEEKELIANKSENEINKIFDIFTINSNLDTKGSRGLYRGANSDLIIKDIEVMSIPATVNQLSYDISQIKSYLIEKGFEVVNKGQINKYIDDLIINYKISNYVELLEQYSKTRAYNKLLSTPEECDGIEQLFINYFIAIIEIYKLDKPKFNQFVDYQQYKLKYKLANNLLNDIKTFDDFELKLKKDGNKLLLEFPKATLISNGQRDVIVFLANLLKLEFNFLLSNKTYGLVVIDEVFDYLDDANLLVAQYYLVNFIQKINKSNKKLFTILLTHLAPTTFNHFYFNRKKLKKIFYLTEVPAINDNVVSFIDIREKIKKTNQDKYNIMSKFLHYGIENIDLPNIDGLEASFSNINSFIELIKEEYRKYYNKINYCPFSVAIYLRIFVEQDTYTHLENQNLENEYLLCHTTIEKLDFAKDKGIDIDEKYYLLSAIYNEMAHNNKEILYFKLNHNVIRNLITSVIGEQ